eukprot:TRINITY_DN27662_c0_g1_i2.p1 TRINITY_DN27662_c0_g1~~TRINITY_DN27662_c0_g1_i2.p1  ORF type:complete len:223 (-),score=75.52 TRINITY_DN27662_c0_g1_i2:158-826(-)
MLSFSLTKRAQPPKRAQPDTPALFDDPNADPEPEPLPVRAKANKTSEFDHFTATEESERRKAAGDSMAEQGRFGDALSEWLKALQLAPSNPKLYEQRAQVLLELGQSFDAVQEAQKAVNLEPEYVAALFTLGRAQTEIGELELGLRHLNRARELDPTDEDINFELKRVRELVDKARTLGLNGIQVRDSVGSQPLQRQRAEAAALQAKREQLEEQELVQEDMD